MSEFLSHNIEDTFNFAQEIIKKLSQTNTHIITLTGDLGAGKTTITQFLGQHLGVSKTIKSPTFTIFKVYSTNSQKYKTICHVDAYRLESSQEIIDLGVIDYLNDPETLTIIEWPQKINELLHSFDTFNISISHGSEENERIFTY